ncbi:hypothetical protein RIVM261_065460 [Rivularia sp. IAM M-261]|nr:hypothetical protein RIVM261_065460 [Rivularia sp. IAM M-261]
MSTPFFIAQTGSKPKKVTSTTQTTQTSQANIATAENSEAPSIWMLTSGVLLVLLVAGAIYTKMQSDKLNKRIRFEKFRTSEFEKKLKLALETIRKMETNPDLINSREFNLDYLRMRMAEEVFHFAIVNQVKIKVKDKITQALRPSQINTGVVGIANSNGRQVDEIFDVEHEIGTAPNIIKRVLFRIQIRLMKLPTQATSATISQIIDCIETYLSPAEDHDTWQPTIQGRIAFMHWDQKAKPTPLLVLEQSNEGVNVTFRTSRQANGMPTPTPENTQGRTQGVKSPRQGHNTR